MVELLPYQEGSTLPTEDMSSTDVLDSVAMAESRTNNTLCHNREVLMVRQPPHIPMPQPPDVQSGDESLSSSSADTPTAAKGTDEQKATREKKNK